MFSEIFQPSIMLSAVFGARGVISTDSNLINVRDLMRHVFPRVAPSKALC